ncbi:hypothetical protein ACSBOX_14845 [Arthrobacter sp. KN11-1C]|uniref:hypothetical protein n=1 Tax=Arthrobacter sp. KN11-1C TaxID=3445774 RepID=UPI003F9EF72C
MWQLQALGLAIKPERITDIVSKRRAAGKDIEKRKPRFRDSQIENAARLIESNEPAAQEARGLGMSRPMLYGRVEAPVFPAKASN